MMIPSFLIPVIVCRPALPLDTLAVMKLTREIWGGEDYVPYVWEEWLEDPEGLLVVAEWGGKIAGLGKLTRLGPQEWWLEGLRTHPKLQGRGIASHLHDYMLGYWQRNCGGVIRLVTNSRFKPVQHLSERTGFTRIHELTLFTAPALAAGEPNENDGFFRPLNQGEADAALAFARQSPALEWTSGLIDLGWQWASPSAAILEEAIERKMAWWWANGGETHRALLVLREEEDEKRAYIEWLACASEEVGSMLASARCLAKTIGYAHIAWVAPLHPTLLPLLSSAGFTRRWEDSLYLYERRLHSGELRLYTGLLAN